MVSPGFKLKLKDETNNDMESVRNVGFMGLYTTIGPGRMFLNDSSKTPSIAAQVACQCCSG